MRQVDPKKSNRLTRGVAPDWMKGSGPFVGRITNHLDSDFMGRLEVEILKITETGNEDSETSAGYTVPCSYVSPFYGVTPRSGVSKNAGYDFTQKSYGMWAIPPDVGVKVIVFFAEENYGHGYWIGCVQDKNMNFMLPGGASTTFNDADKGTALPVGEYNKKVETGAGKDATQYIKPHSPDQVEQLKKAGLIADHVRGTNTSSARREVPSMVFGWSTPGALDRRPGKPKAAYGEKFAQSQVPFSRLGGSTFIMDDGDAAFVRKTKASEGPAAYADVEAGESGDPTLPANDFLKLRTRTGHQILLHNSEDLIYISHGSGDSWIELTANGKIDIYSKDSVSIHTENDFNFKADRDINLQAGRNINLNATENIFETAGINIERKAGENILDTAAMNIEIKAGEDGKITTAGKLDIDTPNTHMNNIDVTGKALVSQMVNTPMVQAGNVNGTAAGASWPNPGAYQQLGGYGASPPTAPTSAQDANDAKTPKRVPEHEPWQGHESIDPTLHTIDKTDVSEDAETVLPEAPRIKDTFKKQ